MLFDRGQPITLLKGGNAILWKSRQLLSNNLMLTKQPQNGFRIIWQKITCANHTMPSLPIVQVVKERYRTGTKTHQYRELKSFRESRNLFPIVCRNKMSYNYI